MKIFYICFTEIRHVFFLRDCLRCEQAPKGAKDEYWSGISILKKHKSIEI